MERHVRIASMLSCALALVVGGSAVATAQDGPPDSQAPARFAATLGPGTFDDQTVTTVAIVEASDPRVSGTWSETSGVSSSILMDGGSGVVTVWWNDITIDNAAGSWTGHSEGFGQAEDFDSDLSPGGETVFLVGEGAYEGMTATLFSPEGQARDPSAVTGGSFEGVIFPTGWHPVATS